MIAVAAIRTKKTCAGWFLTCMLLLLASASAQLLAQDTDPPSRVARLSYLSGQVSFEPAGESQWSDASRNYPLTTGDRIYTGQNARAELETGNLAIRASANTDLTTTDLSNQLVQLGLAQGTVEVRPYEVLGGSAVEVDTPNVAVTITQAGNYRIESYPDEQTTVVSVRSGYAELSGGGINQTLRSGQALRLVGGAEQVQAEEIGLRGFDSFDSWSSDRDRGYESSRSANYVSRYTPGYYDLDQYGDWSPQSDYGEVWYPRSVQADWVPYRYGRWAWVSPWGWTWVDEEPWGFAPFHYGRWAFIGERWGWIPGPVLVAERPVYAPALVAFVGGEGFSFGFGGGGVQAWFPLGPGEIYRPWYHHSDNYIRQVNITNVRNVNITNITNINNVNVNNVKYVNRTAVTAVPTAAFRSSQPVAAHAVKVDRQQIAQAQVIPHAEAAPLPRAVVAGAPPTNPPVRAARPPVAQRTPAADTRAVTRPGAPQVATGQGRAPLPSGQVNREKTAQPNPMAEGANNPNVRTNVPPPQQNRFPEGQGTLPNRRLNVPPTAPAPVTRNLPPQSEQVRPNQNTDRPQFVTRNPPPAPKPSFEARQPAQEQHPGRPLEPQQEQNLRQGRPAGPMQDREPAPHSPQFHAAPPPQRQEPQRQVQQEPQPHGEARPAPAPKGEERPK